MSTEGTLEERGARLGKLALHAPVSMEEAVFVDGFRTILDTDAGSEGDGSRSETLGVVGTLRSDGSRVRPADWPTARR
jgi:hypothetical protein